MMLSERHRPDPAMQVPPWFLGDSNPAIGVPSNYSPHCLREAFAALQRYLPDPDPESVSDDRESDFPVDAYSCDQFRMFEFKVRQCARGRSHDWTECPYAHPGEKARRRDPRKYHYSGTSCPDFRKGNCRKGDACEFAHGVFECWLHPARYRTQPCKDGTNCRRRVCFFAHTPDQLRVLPQHSAKSGNSSDSVLLSFSPPVTPDGSPPLSPLSRSVGSSSMKEMMASMRNLQLGKMKSLPSSWVPGTGFPSPRGASFLGPGFCSVPTTPTGLRYIDFSDKICEDELVMERVESGRDIRVKMVEKLRKDNNVPDRAGADELGPDVGWVSELIK